MGHEWLDAVTDCSLPNANPHLLLAKLSCLLLLKQGPKSGAAATASGLALPSRSRCHGFSSGDDSSREMFSGLHLADQPCSIPSFQPRGCSRSRRTQMQGSSRTLASCRPGGWLSEVLGWGWVGILSLGKSRQGSRKKRHGGIRGGGEKKGNKWGLSTLPGFHSSLIHCSHPFRVPQTSLTLAYWSFSFSRKLKSPLTPPSHTRSSLRSPVISFHLLRPIAPLPTSSAPSPSPPLQSSCRTSPVPPIELYWQRWLLQCFSL